MLFTADEEADRWLCCGLIPNSKIANKDTNQWVQVIIYKVFVVTRYSDHFTRSLQQMLL